VVYRHGVSALLFPAINLHKPLYGFVNFTLSCAFFKIGVEWSAILNLTLSIFIDGGSIPA